MSIGLALSGGGFRATLFHLGVIEGLRNSGRLPGVTDIAGVSGGSIVAAHLVKRWDDYNGTDDQFNAAVGQILALVRSNVRDRVLQKLRWRYPFFHSRPTWRTFGLLERVYREELLGNTTFNELSRLSVPHLSILGTSLNSGQTVAFHTGGVRVGPTIVRGSLRFPIQDYSNSEHLLSVAVAASAAHPLLSSPYESSITGNMQDGCLGKISQFQHWIADGGLYDNLGVTWLASDSPRRDNHQFLKLLLISDAGRPFHINPEPYWRDSLPSVSKWWWRNLRGIDVSFERVRKYDLEQVSRIVIDHRVFEIAQTYPVRPNRPNSEEQRFSALVRTDLNAFSNDEIDVLRSHGRAVVEDVFDRTPL